MKQQNQVVYRVWQRYGNGPSDIFEKTFSNETDAKAHRNREALRYFNGTESERDSYLIEQAQHIHIDRVVVTQ